jgi:hypothetical protein
MAVSPRRRRIALTAGLVLLSAGLGSLVTALAFWMKDAFAAGPPVVQKLVGSTWEQMDADLDRRLRTRFPVGTPAEKLTAMLTQEGFHADSRLEDPLVHHALARWTKFPCAMIAEVTWSQDSQGLISSIDGYYHEAGCT